MSSPTPTLILPGCKSLHPLPKTLPPFLEPFLPTLTITPRPFVTLTYAQSLDSKIAAKPGTRTVISHLETKTMTHFLRSVHDGILIGVGTALADDPGLNCRFNECGTPQTPRPIILDPHFKWCYKGSKIESLVLRGESKEPWVIVGDQVNETEKVEYLEKFGGKVIKLRSVEGYIQWDSILECLKINGIDSLMIEGGAQVINQLLCRPDLVNSLIITIGPTFLGNQGVSVSPPQNVNLRNVTWWSGTQDTIMAAKLTTLERTI